MAPKGISTSSQMLKHLKTGRNPQHMSKVLAQISSTSIRYLWVFGPKNPVLSDVIRECSLMSFKNFLLEKITIFQKWKIRHLPLNDLT